eukprot:TRINITY_DN2449_c0_g1_i5.p1 TRINITY_DN2449_c0_g1~~TRINITY_DN2449_c0_g1_i5.p1  ORF type:complete len:199 (-),score=11.17 TRINITY_DN2449_c0_g1_i5:99-695(-)
MLRTCKSVWSSRFNPPLCAIHVPIYPRAASDIFGDIVVEPEPELVSTDKQEIKPARTRAFAKKTNLGTSVQKLKEVCFQIRGLPVEQAIKQLQVNPRKPSTEVEKVVKMAFQNALYHNIQGDLYVSDYKIGRGTPLKRIKMHAKGRYGKVHRPRTHLVLALEPLHSLKGRRWELRRKSLEVKSRFASWRMGLLSPTTE